MKKLTFLLLLLSSIVLSCTTTKYVPIVETHTRVEVQRDTIETHDTINHERTTIVRELDSLAMAEFGIQLNGMQKAWLVEKNDLLRQLSSVKENNVQEVVRVDTIPQIVTVEVEKSLTTWEKLKIKFGEVLLLLLFCLCSIFFISRVKS